MFDMMQSIALAANVNAEVTGSQAVVNSLASLWKWGLVLYISAMMSETLLCWQLSTSVLSTLVRLFRFFLILFDLNFT